MAEQQGGVGSQIGKAITKKLSDSLKNMDVLGLLQNLVAMTPEDEESEEIRGKLQDVMKQYNDMPEDEKVLFANQLKDALATKLQAKLDNTPFDLSGVDAAISRAIYVQVVLYGLAALFLLILIVFFGYKLYKSIKDKELKREEKKKAKQMKKKK
ncbi:uncharacterized protein LOC106715217 isoform X1 [Papilio machaon]|uniref:uncharacterized protein LOC106715217 isoform X1 n=1 Tax=Papilio machaon TaxID=76193 RepID=UPI001E66518D|nr:uncharacterized protein LOC106715217 isoform X1 [Papilio machaon]